jgi:hypothetical protein
VTFDPGNSFIWNPSERDLLPIGPTIGREMVQYRAPKEQTKGFPGSWGRPKRILFAQNVLRFLAYPMTDMPSERATIAEISLGSPLDLVMYGIPSACTLAAIISGGKINIGTVRIELPPIGVGIKALRDALGYAYKPIDTGRKRRTRKDDFG